MKKFFYMSVLVLMAALTLTSCGSDDDEKQKDEPTGTVAYDATVSLSQDLIDICDVTITYKDADGKTATEAVKSTSWNKKFTVKKLPAVVGAKCEFKLKSGVQLTKDKYDLSALLYHNVTVNGAKKGYDQPFTFYQGAGVKADQVAEILSKWSGRQVYGYTISAKGEVTTTESIDF